MKRGNRLNHLRTYIAALLALVMVLALAGCSKNGGDAGGTGGEEPFSKDIFAMDTYMTLSAYGDAKEDAVNAAIKEINRLDALLSTGKDTSEVSKLNKNGGGDLSEDTNVLMAEALKLYGDTDHLFDITIYPVMELWGFTSGEFRVPTEAELAKALTLVDAGEVRYDANTRHVSYQKDGMAIDFGGLAKGYTSAKVAELYKEMGVTSGLVNLGGNVQAVGYKPDGTDWRIGIQHPADAEQLLGVVKTHDAAVITSGGYERYFEEDGVTYHHIIDPATGHPADSGLISVTIVSADGMLADGLSTSLFIMGKDRAAAFWQKHKNEFQFVLCEKDGTLIVSDGLKDTFTPSDENAKVEYVS